MTLSESILILHVGSNKKNTALTKANKSQPLEGHQRQVKACCSLRLKNPISVCSPIGWRKNEKPNSFPGNWQSYLTQLTLLEHPNLHWECRLSTYHIIHFANNHNNNLSECQPACSLTMPFKSSSLKIKPNPWLSCTPIHAAARATTCVSTWFFSMEAFFRSFEVSDPDRQLDVFAFVQV